jgi:protein TonB
VINDPNLSKEAVRLVRTMPNWTPGQENGKPVRVRMELVVEFKLD